MPPLFSADTFSGQWTDFNVDRCTAELQTFLILININYILTPALKKIKKFDEKF